MSDDDVIGDIYAGSFQRLVVQLYAVTGDLSEAQEAVQESFTRALAAPRRFARLENPEAWLRRVAVNVARSRYRRRRVLDGLLRRIGPPSVVADTAPEHLALLAALRELPTGQRHALALHYLREYGREGDTGVAPGQAWLYGRDDMSVLGADHVQLTSDGQSWVRFPLPD